MHPVVNESFLLPYRDGSAQYPEREAPPPEPEEVDGEKHYHVEAFREHRFRYGHLEYRVKWLGYPETSNTWQRISVLREDLSPDVLAALVEEYRRERALEDGFDQQKMKRKSRKRRE